MGLFGLNFSVLASLIARLDFILQVDFIKPLTRKCPTVFLPLDGCARFYVAHRGERLTGAN